MRRGERASEGMNKVCLMPIVFHDLKLTFQKQCVRIALSAVVLCVLMCQGELTV